MVMMMMMDHGVVPRPCKICGWLLNPSWDHFGLRQGKNVIVTMEFGVPIRHILRHTLSTIMVQRVLQWERQNRFSSRKRQGPVAERCCYNNIWMNLLLGKEVEDKRRQHSGQNLTFYFIVLFYILFLSKLMFCGIYLENQHIRFWVHGHSSWSTFGLHPMRGPKAL